MTSSRTIFKLSSLFKINSRNYHSSPILFIKKRSNNRIRTLEINKICDEKISKNNNEIYDRVKNISCALHTNIKDVMFVSIMHTITLSCLLISAVIKN